MPHNLTFNGIRKTWLILRRGRQKAPFTPLRRNLISVPGMPGAHLQSTDVEPIVINQPIGFKVDDDEHALQLKDEFAAWLVTDEPVPLQFDDEPGRTYYAVVQNTIEDFEKFAELRQGTIQFLCLDPYGYGPELPATFPSDAVTLTNNGTAPADPIFELEVLEPVTFAMIQNQDDEYQMIGRPVDIVEQEPFEREELTLNDGMSSTVGWTNATEIDGTAAGSMESNGSRFQPVDFGSGSGWHGPAMKRSLSETLTDFRMEAIVGFWNGTPAEVGRVEIYLLDDQNRTVAKTAMKDTRDGESLGWGEARAGDGTINHHLINEYGDRKGNWNNFYGMLRIERIGNQWAARIAKIDNQTGRHHTIRYVSWTDADNVFDRNVSQVVVHFGRYGNNVSGAMGVYQVKVWKINQEQDYQVPYIAEPGDTITFDHTTEDLLINGEDRTDLKDFGANYFKLKKGGNQLTVMPFDSFSTKVRYRPRYS